MAEISPTSADLWLLDGPLDFSQHALKLAQRARRDVAILTQSLDMKVYAQPDFIQTLSHLARTNHNAQIHLLIKNTKLVFDSGHPLLRLAQRLSSRIKIRKLTLEPDNKDMGFMLCDNDGLLYKNDDATYRGFANYAALREVRQLREQFNYIWQYGDVDPELQLLHL